MYNILKGILHTEERGQIGTDTYLKSNVIPYNNLKCFSIYRLTNSLTLKSQFDKKEKKMYQQYDIHAYVFHGEIVKLTRKRRKLQTTFTCGSIRKTYPTSLSLYFPDASLDVSLWLCLSIPYTPYIVYHHSPSQVCVSIYGFTGFN